MRATDTTATGLAWVKDDDPRWDDDRERVFGSVPDGVFPANRHVMGERLPSDWWRVVDGGRVVGYGWLDDVWGDAEVLLVVEAGARGSGAGSFALSRLEAEAAARGLNYVLNVVRDTHPERDATTAWFLAHGFSPSDDGRLRKRVGGGAAHAPVPDGGRQERYRAERDRAAASRGPDVPSAPGPDRGPGAEESGGYVDAEQHRY